jgi:serine/threonine protein kinase
MNRLAGHPNIVEITSSVEKSRSVPDFTEFSFILTPFADRKHFPHHRRPESMLRKVFTDIMAALNFAHSKNIIHRDVKRENILITKDF